MAKLLKLRRGTTTQHSSFTGAEGEVTVDTDKETLVVHDGSTAGGHPVAAEDMANVSSSAIAGRLSNDSIAVSKIAAGTLPSDVKIQDANVSGNLTIDTADLVTDAVTNAKLAHNAVYTNAIQDDAVTSAKIADGTIVAANIANDTITATQLANNSANVNVIVDGAVTTVKLAADAVDGTKIADDSINSEHYVDGSIDAAHIASNAVTTSKINTNAVDLDKIQTITTSRILGRVTGGTGNVEQLSADNVRTMINVENGATADQSNAEIRAAVEAASDSNVFTDADHSKLNGIEASATADQTAAEIRSLVESASDSNVFTDADHSKLNGIEASATADQTASEIASALDGQDIYTDQKIGRDAGDYMKFNNNSHVDIVINSNNEFRFEHDGDFHADGDVIAFSTTTASDRKLKENIEVVPNALEKVQALDGVTFTWKRDGTPSAGVIAQEVQGVLPEAVKEVTPVGGGDSHLSVNYHALTSILIESIKELKAEIEQLKGGQ